MLVRCAEDERKPQRRLGVHLSGALLKKKNRRWVSMPRSHRMTATNGCLGQLSRRPAVGAVSLMFALIIACEETVSEDWCPAVTRPRGFCNSMPFSETRNPPCPSAGVSAALKVRHAVRSLVRSPMLHAALRPDTSGSLPSGSNRAICQPSPTASSPALSPQRLPGGETDLLILYGAMRFYRRWFYHGANLRSPQWTGTPSLPGCWLCPWPVS